MKKTVSLKQVLIINILSLVLITSLFLVYQVVASPNEVQSQANSDGSVLSYQGILLDSEGSPINGLTDIIFAIYGEETSGAALWQESHSGANAIPVIDGLVNITLGSLIPIPTSVWESPELFMGIKVGADDELAPRELISSVPSAASAGTAQMALAVANGAVGSNGFAPTWYKAHNSTAFENESTTFMPTEDKITFFCDVDCSVLVMHQALVMHTFERGRVDVRVQIDGTTVIQELSYPYGYFGQVNGQGIFNLSAGTHTVEVLFANNHLFEGAAKYYGDSSGTWDYLYVMLFAKGD